MGSVGRGDVLSPLTDMDGALAFFQSRGAVPGGTVSLLDPISLTERNATSGRLPLEVDADIVCVLWTTLLSIRSQENESRRSSPSPPSENGVDLRSLYLLATFLSLNVSTAFLSAVANVLEVLLRARNRLSRFGFSIVFTLTSTRSVSLTWMSISRRSCPFSS